MRFLLFSLKRRIFNLGLWQILKACSISPSAMLTGIPLCCKLLLLESSAQSGGSGKSGGRVGGGPVIYIHCSSLSQ